MRCALRSDTVYVLIADRSVLEVSFDRLIRAINRCIGEAAVAKDRA